MFGRKQRKKAKMSGQAHEYSGVESACCSATLRRRTGSGLMAPWYCEECGTPWDPTTGVVARKTCLDCDATLALSDPDLCALCDQARTARQS